MPTPEQKAAALGELMKRRAADPSRYNAQQSAALDELAKRHGLTQPVAPDIPFLDNLTRSLIGAPIEPGQDLRFGEATALNLSRGLAKPSNVAGPTMREDFIVNSGMNALDFIASLVRAALPDQKGKSEDFNNALARGRSTGETALGDKIREAIDIPDDVLRSIGDVNFPAEKILEGGTIVATDILTDPTTYIGIGLATRIKSLFKLGKTDEAAKLAKSALDDLADATGQKIPDTEQLAEQITERIGTGKQATPENASRSPQIQDPATNIPGQQVAQDKPLQTSQPVQQLPGDRATGKLEQFLDETTGPDGRPVVRDIPNATAKGATAAEVPPAAPRPVTDSPPTKTGPDIPEIKDLPAPATKEAVEALDKRLIEPTDAEKIEAAKIAGVALPEGTRDRIRQGWINAREYFQDSGIRLRKLQAASGVKVEKGADPIAAQIRLHGRVSTRLEEVSDELRKLDEGILSASKKTGVSDTELYSDATNWLLAWHTGERNRRLKELGQSGDGVLGTGFTDGAAFTELVRIERLPHFDEAIKPAVDRLRKLNTRTLNLLVDSGVMSAEQKQTLLQRYPNHVPLQRVFEEEQDVLKVLEGFSGQGSGNQGVRNQGTGIFKVEGSEREIADVPTNIAANVMAAVKRSEKNRVAQELVRFGENNEQLGIFKKWEPAKIGETKDGKAIFQDTPENVITAFFDGKKRYVEVPDPRLASALQINNIEELPLIFHYTGAVTRLMSSLATRFNPEFFITNILRDVQEMSVFLAGEGFGAKKSLGVSASALNPRAAIKDITDFMRGKKTPGAGLYAQMRRDGGTTGGLGLSTRDVVEESFEQLKKTNRSTVRRKARALRETIDNFNQIFEDATRLTVYRESLARGISRERAAELAKEATINFNRKGVAGPLVNSLYMFSNASIQGSTKLISSMLKDPKVAAATITAITAPTLAFNGWNDSIYADWRPNIRSYDRDSGLPILLAPPPPGEKTPLYFTLPLSWGLKPIKRLADFVYDASVGIDNGSVADLVVDFFGAFWSAYNPVGGSDFIQAATPSILDVPVDVMRNKAWHAGAIFPENRFNSELPDQLKYFRSMENSATGRALIYATSELAENHPLRLEISPATVKYAMDQFGSGAAKSASRIIDTGSALLQGELPELKDTFLLNRFIKRVSPEELRKSTPYRKLERRSSREIERRLQIERYHRNRKVDDMLAEFEKMKTPQQRQRYLREAAGEDRDLLGKFKRELKQKRAGLNAWERRVKQLPDDHQALAIADDIKRTRSAKQRDELVARYKKIRLVNSRILKEMRKAGVEEKIIALFIAAKHK